MMMYIGAEQTRKRPQGRLFLGSSFFERNEPELTFSQSKSDTT